MGWIEVIRYGDMVQEIHQQTQLAQTYVTLKGHSLNMLLDSLRDTFICISYHLSSRRWRRWLKFFPWKTGVSLPYIANTMIESKTCTVNIPWSNLILWAKVEMYVHSCMYSFSKLLANYHYSNWNSPGMNSVSHVIINQISVINIIITIIIFCINLYHFVTV